MTNSEPSSERQSKEVNKWLVWSIIMAAFIGFLDAMYLTAEHYSGKGLSCFIFTGCDQVANSEYSLLFGLPVALYGVLFYLGILFISLLYVERCYIGQAKQPDQGEPIAPKKLRGIFYLFDISLLPLYTLIGFVMSLRFVYLQAFVIKAYCTYCLFSAATSTLLFILGIILFRKLYKRTHRGNSL